ncbi:basic amino acid ABC transporter substrate-binding protein [Dehalogenimonas alkenigignens]|uniref:ABC-type amino acid transport/signal transduction system, periplasmic component/domain n=1 Tax=Dehalogenimonas alkenigignens TaxID=1217799 RepID=A0A0W0GHS2_9CHLR|nr:basic amino acid ABC transporter substrate-binding protein [Dehalogenimonas alkenigignens]KTB48084.1 ABC-type amino acid transport/signal transduction system, periplasmic component/domain [Dehalogenimonas alkenigignens]PVV84336.1 basic amino acid ABC transporter substrate-binding protein [Dehalogenimonas alkenigignens]
MKKFLWILVALVAVFGLALPGCGDSSANPTTSAPPLKIRVATDATWAPFEFVDTASGKIVGFDIDLFNEIAKKANIEVEYVNVEWDSLLAGMAQGTYDAAISSITITEDRKKEMNFTNPYYAAGQIIVVRSNNTTITGAANIKGKVGVQSGTTGDTEVSAMTGVEKVAYDEIGLAFAALLTNQIDAIVCDTPVAAGYTKKNPTQLKTVGAMLSAEEYGIAVPKGKEDLLAKLNTALAQVKAAGTIPTLLAKWEIE